MRTFSIFYLAFLTAVNMSTAQAVEFDAAARIGEVADYLDRQTIAVAHVDLAQAESGNIVEKVGATFASIVPLGSDIKATAQKLETLRAALQKAGVQHIYAVVSLADFPGYKPYVVAPVAVEGDARAVAGLLFGGDAQGPTSDSEARRTNYRGPEHFELCRVVDRVVIAGSAKTVERVHQQLRQNRRLEMKHQRELITALAAAGTAAIQVVVVPSDDSRRVLTEMLPRLPDKLGPTSGEQLVRGFHWGAASLGTAPDISVQLTIRSMDEPSAKAIQQALRGGLELIAQLPAVRKNVPKLMDVVQLLVPKVEGSELSLRLTHKNEAVQKLATVLFPLVAEQQYHALVGQSMHILKPIGLAMHNFHEKYKSFPPSASYDEKGRKLLSWRVYLLPWLNHKDLYEKFRLDEPWDSEHNRTLISQIPSVYRSPLAGSVERGKTTYLVPIGKTKGKEFLTIFAGKVGVPISEIHDGTTQTVLVVDVAPKFAVPWTKPDDLQVDFEDPRTRIFGPASQRAAFLFADGSVRVIQNDQPDDVRAWRGLFTRKGGEVITGF